jgi:hypothetical protein
MKVCLEYVTLTKNFGDENLITHLWSNENDALTSVGCIQESSLRGTENMAKVSQLHDHVENGHILTD